MKKSFKLLTALLISSLLVFSLVPYEARAAAGIYGRLNFQGKVVNSDGTNVSDGTYDFVFKTYDGAGSGVSTLWTESWTSAVLWSSTMSSAPGLGGESLVYVSDTNESTLKVGQTVWNTTKEEAVTVTSVNTETNTLEISPTRQAWAVSDTVTNKIYVKDGIFSVQLNSLNADWSLVDWNSDSLFLGANFNSDGEMKPRKRLTAVPYAHNANLLNGLSSGSLLRSDASDNYTSGTLTLDAGSILDVNGTLALGGATILESLDMANNIITNIGNAGTDFDPSGGLTLAGDLLLDKIDTATVAVTEYPSPDLILRGSGWKMGSADWNFRKKITIDHTKVDDNLTDFPLLINLSSDSDLASWAQDDGDDIYFTKSDGVTKLDHEIEKFDGSTGELIAWVRIPSLSSTTDIEIYMYYANQGASNQENVTGVWNSNFKMVQHLHETSKTTGAYNDHLDSTSNNNDGEAEGGVIMDAAGQINGADGFDGVDDYVEAADSASLDITNEITVEAWVNDPTIVEQIAASYDDGACDDSANHPTDTYANCATAWVKAGLRWSMNIPEGAIISSAYIRVKSGDNSSGTDDGKIELFDEDNATDFSASFWTRAIDSGAGSVTWDYPSWTINEWYDSPDISSLVQAFINRPGYSPGNYIGLRITGLSEVGDWRSFLTHDGAPADAPELHIEYVLPNKKVVGKGIDAYEIQMDNDLNVTGFINNQSVTTLTTKAWHYIVLTYNGSDQKLYVDGVLKDSVPLSGSINTNANNLIIGEYVNGPIDEVRISNTSRSAEWVSTTHSNHNNPDSFYSLSSQEGIDGGAVGRDVILRNIITYDYYNDPIGRLAFLNSGDIEFVSFDATNQRVGIGTTTPSQKLVVVSNGNVTEIGDSSNFIRLVNPTGIEQFRVDVTGLIFANGFISKEMNFSDEFIRNFANIAADTAGGGTTGMGDSFSWGAGELGTCIWSNVTDAASGILRSATNATGSGCLTYISEGARNPKDILKVANNPVIVIKLLPSVVGQSNWVIAGMADYTDGAVADPTNGIYFSSEGSQTWVGVVKSGATKNTVTCTGQTISTTNYAYLRITVSSGEKVEFFVDNNVSDGINPVSCGSISAGIPVVNLAPEIMNQARTGGVAATNLDIDFVRLSQDDPIATGGKTAVQEPSLLSRAEIAEEIPAMFPDEMEPGDVLSLVKGEKVKAVHSSKPYESTLYGVVSTDPGVILGEGTENSIRVALAGRAPVKVNLENGPIAIGDPLTSSSQPGVAMKATKVGFTVGRALEPYDNPDPNAVGKIMVFVNLGWYSPAEEGIFQKLTAAVGAIFNHLVAKTAEFTSAVIGNLQAVTLNVTGELITPIANIKEINSEQLTTDRLKIREEGETVGEGTIPVGETELVIENAEVTENSRIFVTPTTSTGGQALFVSEKKAGKSFTVSIDKELETDIIFNFWVIN